MKHSQISLRSSILLIFVTLFLLVSFMMITLRTIVFDRELSYTSAEIMNYVSDAVLHQLREGLRPVAIESQFSAHLLKSDVLTDNPKHLVPYTFYIVKMMPLVRAAYWADEDGDFIFAKKEADGSVTSDLYMRKKNAYSRDIFYRDPAGNIIKQIQSTDLSYQPTDKNWYQDAKRAQRTVWTNIYLLYPQKELGITSATPVYNDKQQLRGVFGFDIDLNYLTQFVTQQKVSKNGYSFVITKNEELVAYPERPPFIKTKTRSQQLINVHQIGLPLIDESLDRYKKTGQSLMTLQYEGKDYMVHYQPVEDLAQHGWLIGVVTPTSDFVGFLQHLNVITFGISLLILALGIVIMSSLIKRIVKPIRALVKETKKIKELELDTKALPPSRISEVMQLSDAFEAMKRSLRQFQMYVPKILVKQLIESGHDIHPGGERKSLVVLFTDIEDFTRIAENIDPNALMLQLCEYFETLSRIVLVEHGTIDKYIGDSLMAFWGAPLEENAPCAHGAATALHCQAALEKLNSCWEKVGKPCFKTRFGIHTGEAIVGNLGSSERLNYTAIGDTINITSRLENINKLYHTNIVVSDSVYKQIKDQFVLRIVDCVMLKGKTKPTTIYELLAEDAKELSFDIDAYRQAFAQGFYAYQEQQRQAAITHFKVCLEIYPEDQLAPIFIARCQ